MSIIPRIGFVGSFIAFIPIVGMFVHWVLFFLLVFFIFIVLSAPTYIRNKDAKSFILSTKMIIQMEKGRCLLIEHRPFPINRVQIRNINK